MLNLAMDYFNLQPIDFPPEFEDKMFEAYYAVSHPNLEACHGNGTWTWSNSTYDNYKSNISDVFPWLHKNNPPLNLNK